MNKLKYKWFAIGIIFLALLYALQVRTVSHPNAGETFVETAALRTFDIEVRTVGELEASRSILIMSPIRGEQGKIIDIIADGTYVKPHDLLVKLDPTPFEERIVDLQASIREQECNVKALEQALESEICQNEHEITSGEYEMRSAALEVEKILKGDGPQEIAKLKSAMQKATIKYEEIQGYSKELQELEDQGFLSTSELLQAKKKLQDEEEAYEIAKLEYDCFVNYVHPMRIEKANTALKRATSKLEEITRIGKIKLIRDRALLEHAQKEIVDMHQQCQNAEAVLLLTNIKAPASGIVVLKEEFRNGQRRKPRVGDQVICNQPILDLPDLESLIVKTKVREADLHKVQVGKGATITLDAYPQLHLKGKVLSIGVLALSDSSKMGDEKYFDIRIGLDKGDSRLRPGMTARAVILAEQVQNKLTIPIHAVFEKDKRHFCYTKKGENYALTPLKLGASNEYWTLIEQGLEAGSEVCLHLPPKHLILSANSEGKGQN